MSKNLVFVGKEYPSSSVYALQAQSLGFNVVLSVQEKTAITEDTESLKYFLWNRESQISAHSLLISAENALHTIDTAVIVFDASDFVTSFDDSEISDYSRAVESLILSYNYLAYEFLTRFKVKKHGNIVFVLKGFNTIAENLKSSRTKDIAADGTGVILSFVQAAFRAFAENFAAMNFQKSCVEIALFDGSTYSDEEISEHLFTKIIPEFEVQPKKQKKIFEGFKPIGKASIFSRKLY